MGDSKWLWFYEICRAFSLFVGCSLNPFGSWRRLPAGIPYLGNVRLVGRDCEALWWKRGTMGSKRSVWCGAAFKEWQEAPCSIRSDTILREPAIRKKSPCRNRGLFYHGTRLRTAQVKQQRPVGLKKGQC